MHFDDYGFLQSLQLRFWFLVTNMTEGDSRNWEAVRACADEVRPLLLA
jgi:hypothetical protein